MAQVKAHASPAEVETEIRAQVARARQFGMKPTHLDSHMGTLFADARYFDVYVRVAKEVGIVPMLMAPAPEIVLQAKLLGLDYLPLYEKLKGQGYLFLDRLDTGLKADTYEERKTKLHELVRTLKPGLTELIVHLSGDDEEIRHVTGNWQARAHEGRLMVDPETKAFIREQKVKLVGYRALAALWEKK